MSRKILSACLCTALLAVSTLGCGTTGTERAERTVKASELLKGEFDGLTGQIDVAVQALEGVVAAASGGDLRASFDKYVTELGTLASQAESVVATAKDLRSRSQAYLDGWEKQMAGVELEALKEIDAKRREEARQQFGEITDELERIGEDYRSFVKSLDEIKLFLDNQLNPAGVAAVAPIVARAKEDSKPVKEDIDTIKAGLDKIKSALSAGSSAEPGTTTGG